MATPKVKLTIKAVPETPVVFQDTKIKGVLIGVITPETSIKEYKKLVSQVKNDVYSHWVDKDGIRVYDYEILTSKEEFFPFTGWSFPTKPKPEKEITVDNIFK